MKRTSIVCIHRGIMEHVLIYSDIIYVDMIIFKSRFRLIVIKVIRLFLKLMQ